MLGGPGKRDQRLRVGERPAPPIEPDHASELTDHLTLERLAVEARLAEPLEAVSASGTSPVGRHRPTIPANDRDENPNFLGLRGGAGVPDPGPNAKGEAR